jgi:uncharacterized membrane protein YqiK
MLEACKLEAQSTLVRAQAEANAIVKKAEAEAKAVELRGHAEAEALRKQLEALEYTPPAEWMRLMQVRAVSRLRKRFRHGVAGWVCRLPQRARWTAQTSQFRLRVW